MRAIFAISAVAAALGMSACGQEAPEEPTGGASQEQGQADTAEPEDTSEPKPDCEKASRKLLQAIGIGLEGVRLSRGYVVRSADFAKVYIVAAEIDGPGLEDEGDVGVWGTNSKRADGLIFAVDAVAQEFSDWGDGDKTDAQIDQSVDGVDQARECTQG